ncbi:dienelactone hydrolase family protein [Streptomyces sanglieri]|uniref:Dienelactone hydrolase family protein n=1 Tax=Streptomyces sanglieri TaxID=193460 RepID=A0ABW2X8C9_9ACTN
MAEVFLFHHAQGLTPGVTAFADVLRREGHTVHTPDLYDGHTFDTLDEGLAYAEKTGFDELLDRGVRTVTDAPAELVYIGFSLGVLPAQKLAQTRPGARGAVFVHSCVPSSAFGTWPARLPVRIHAMEADRLFTDEGDADAAHASTRQPTPNCTSIPATGTCSPTTPCRPTTPGPPHFSSTAH